MADVVFDRLLDQLAAISYSGSFAFHRYNEPTLRKDLENLVERTRRQLPRASILLYSNGTLLSAARRRKLFLAGVDKMVVTDHARMGIPPEPRVTIMQPEDLVISTRAGWISSVEKPLKLPCFCPSEKLVVGHNGDVYLCVQDYGREYVMGNLVTQSLAEIWLLSRFQAYRALLAVGERSEACELCAKCDGKDYTKARTTV